MPDIKKALDVYVRLAADAGEYDLKQLREILDGYYELRRAAEDDLQVRIFPTLSAEQLREEVERAAVRSPADEFIAKTAAPEDPPEETQVTQDAFEPVPPPVPTRGTAAAKFKRDVRDRIETLRKQGVSLQSIIDATGGAVSMSEILDVLQAARVEYSVYRELDAGLRKLDNAE